MWKLFGYVLLFALMFAAAVPAQAQITGSNWTGTFYNDTTLTSPVAEESYPNGLYFNWGLGPALKADNATPVPGVSVDHFSARFASTQTFAQGGRYVFTVYVDDGIRVFLDDTLVLNEFNQNTGPNYQTFRFYRTISAGDEIDIRVEYVEITGSAIFVFQWGLVTDPPTTLELLSPIGNVQVVGLFSPTFIWHEADTPSYVFKVWPVGGSTLVQASYAETEICSGGVCSLDSSVPPYPDDLALKTGHYAWRVITKGAVTKVKSDIAYFTIEYPGKPMGLTPDFYTTIADTSPVLIWDEGAVADEYKVVLTRTKTGEKTKTGWLLGDALGCDGIWCTLDLGALESPVTLKRGNYTWRVFARNLSLKVSLSKSAPAAFRVVPQTRSAPLPIPDTVAGFRAP